MATISRRDVLSAGVGAVPLLGLAAVASAQTPPPAAPTRGTADGAAGRMAAEGTSDAPLAACMLIKGKKQIEVCRFALTKIQDADVKAFAQAEIDEHETLKKKLQTLGYDAPTPAGAGGAAPRGAGTPPGAAPTTTNPTTGSPPPATGRNDGTPAAGAPAATGARMAGGTVVMVGKATLDPGTSMVIDIDREVGEQCAATCKSELSKLDGVKFDKAFVGGQLHAHYDLFDHDVVFRKHATAAMAPALDEARAIIEKHIATCKQLMEKLEGQK